MDLMIAVKRIKFYSLPTSYECLSFFNLLAIPLNKYYLLQELIS